MKYIPLLLLCGCAVSQPQKSAQSLTNTPEIRLGWTAGYYIVSDVPFAVTLPKTSGIESSEDFESWLSETNLPVTGYQQEMQATFERKSQWRFYRAVDQY